MPVQAKWDVILHWDWYFDEKTGERRDFTEEEYRDAVNRIREALNKSFPYKKVKTDNAS